MNWLLVEEKLNVLSQRTNISSYDFKFELFFNCSHPFKPDSEVVCVSRTGAISDYSSEYKENLSLGLRLVNSPEEHLLACELPAWYPIIHDLSPRSLWFESFPSVEEISELFSFPFFMKGARQTSKHNLDLCIIKDHEHYQQVIKLYQLDPILHWQKIVIRDFIELEPLQGSIAGKVKASLEFRSFWWFGSCVGYGHYWYQLAEYTANDINKGLAVAQEAVRRLKIPFVVIDIAKTKDGHWIIIECNDAQESGYTGVNAYQMWQNVLSNGFSNSSL